ncbi:MAG: mandelate racemase/muconate lactonizing enzyme family protein [Candidatus Sericytochromatia bacterium]|uniref:Mandelate racemase/muconate lactonizing enzyme family protein n=1 Tax=Candidatus Tanganyikabacteria bacterium TaxID=2961651 RepID=A0A938BIF5_9BACT|nr:mandelate racemase/muconate lactonizing enzyme family protein [Candidatus Tanganyikabacteria bacterium]
MVLAVRRGYRVDVMDDAGLTGTGEIAPLPEAGTERPSASKRAATAACALPAKDREGDLASIGPLLDELGLTHRVPAARAGFELALLDLAAKRKGCRVADLLSNGAAPLPVPISALAAGETDAELAKRAAGAVRGGIGTLKLKVGSRPLRDDIRRAAAIREAVGMQVKMRVDANRAWPLEEALAALASLREVEPEFVEEPCTDLLGLLAVAPDSGVPIAADESARPSASALLTGPRRPQFLILKVPPMGGLLPAWEVARRAEGAGVRVVVTSCLESPIGLAGALHLASALQAATPDAPAAGLGTLELFAGPSGGALPVTDGLMALPPGPGLGLELPAEAR